MILNPQPVYLELDKRREVAYTVGSALALRAAAMDAVPMVEKLSDEDGKPRYRIFHPAVVAWLAACLQREARRTGDILDAAWVEDHVDTEEKLVAAVGAINEALLRYYGQESEAKGEARPPAKAKARRGKATR